MSTPEKNNWGSDVPISLPVPPAHPIRINMGNNGFTDYGMATRITYEDIENFLPAHMPEDNA